MCYSGCPYERKIGRERIGECIGKKSWEKSDAHCYTTPENENILKARYDAKESAMDDISEFRKEDS